MAQTDFDFFVAGTAPFGGTDGTPVVHSSLSNPLTFHGSFARLYKLADSGGQFVHLTKALVDSGVSSGDFVGPPVTKAVSLRAFVRFRATVDPANILGFIAMMARTSTDQLSSGYYLTLGTVTEWDTSSGTSAALSLRLCKRGPGGTKSGSFLDTVVPGTFIADTWYAVRLDVVPVGTANDRLDVYLAGAITWVLALTETILSTDVVSNPPTASTRVGFAFYGQNPSVFFSIPDPCFGMVDALDFRISTV